MIADVTRANVKEIRNPQLRAYAEKYVQIYEDFARTVSESGIEFDPADHRAEAKARRERLRAKGATFRNNDHSICVGGISPACVACQKGIGSATFFVSLQCHRKCFYCFNPNQEDYEHYAQAGRDVVAELSELAERGLVAQHLALTGGEPLLHPQESVAFFQTARDRFPAAHTRLYTSGDHVDREILAQLKEAGLSEIRFSVRAIDSEKARAHTYERIALAREYIPSVMVETPVLPGTLEIMKEMLTELERLSVFGVNLLEFCFPFHNADAYRERGYQVKNPPYETLYDYWYAGGLPISRSELDCLELMEFALDAGLQIGVHYCSLENKHTGQVYQQDWGADVPATAVVSEQDHFLKTAKVFGDDIAKVRKAFARSGYDGFTLSHEPRYLEFHPSHLADLSRLDLQVAICTQVVEQRAEGPVLRELKVALTTPQTFDLASDL